MKAFVRIISFFAKEINSVRRQPLLLAGLILGPFLILTLFGVGYTGERPVLRTALVVPPGQRDAAHVTELRDNMGATFLVEDQHVYEDQAAAMEALRQGQVDVVEVFPPEITEVYSTGQAVDIAITYNEIDPLLRDWIEYLSYTQINELNKEMLRIYVGEGQQQVDNLAAYVVNARQEVGTLRGYVDSGQRTEAREAIDRLRKSIDVQLLTLGVLAASNNPDAQTTVRRLQDMRQALDLIDSDLDDEGQLAQQEERLNTIDTQLSEVETLADRVTSLDPLVVVSPLRSATTNLVPIAALSEDPGVAYVRFYSPGVVALLLQHMMVTLAGLSLIRERMLGTVEVFRVAPINVLQLLAGKYLGYTLFASIIVVALLPLLVFGLGIPFPLEQAGLFILITLLVVLASLGWGFLISAIVRSDSQAVQFSMLLLLMSVFFSGFFIPLKSFVEQLRTLAKILPVTHGITGFQQILLLNQPPPASTYLWLLAVAVVTFVLSWIIFRRQFQQR